MKINLKEDELRFLVEQLQERRRGNQEITDLYGVNTSRDNKLIRQINRKLKAAWEKEMK